MGGVYRRGKYYHIWFFDQHGERQYEHGNPKWTKKKDADTQLSIREAEVTKHEYKGKHIEEVTFDDLAGLLLEDYRANNRKSTSSMEDRLVRMKKFFGSMKAIHIPSQINRFKAECQEKKLENAYINRYLAALRRMFKLGFRHEPKLVASVPYIQMLVENNVRQGYIEHDLYLKLKSRLPDYLQIAFLISYISGIRKEEGLSLGLDQFNKISGYIRLKAPDTKNAQQRGFSLVAEYYQEVLEWVQKTEAEYPKCKYLVHRNGERISDFRAAWDTALKECGFAIKYKCRDCKTITELTKDVKREDLICSNPKCQGHRLRRDDQVWHDLRRSAARNMRNAGIEKDDIMYIAGWLTDSMFTRYNITNEEDQKAASYKVQDYLTKKEAEIKRYQKL